MSHMLTVVIRAALPGDTHVMHNDLLTPSEQR